MKKFFLPLVILCSMVMSCSTSSDTDNEPVLPGQEVTEQGNVVFQFTSPAISVSTSRTAEDSYKSEQGTEGETKVNMVRIYLFDSKSKEFAMTFLLTKLTKTNTGQTGYVTYTSEHVTIPQGVYDVFAIANTNDVLKVESEYAFLNSIDANTYKQAMIVDTSKGIIMTNRASDNLSTTIRSYDDNKTDNIVEITLERVLARIDIAKAADTFPMKDGEGRTFATAKLDDYHFVNLPRSYYNFRHVAVLNDFTEPQWSLNSNFGNVADVNGYVIDPYFFQKKIDASDFSNQDAYYEFFHRSYTKGENVQWTAMKKASTPLAYNTCYTLENCSYLPAQKNGYSTGVVFRAEIIPNDNVYALVSGSLQKVDKSAYAQNIYYFNYKFYNSIEALAKAGVTVKEDMSAEDLAFLDVTKYENDNGKYYAYYNYWIKHLDNNDPLAMGVMEFAIVRNNLYRLTVTNISYLGPGTPNPVPDTPDEGESYLKIELNVKPWIVRDQNNIVL